MLCHTSISVLFERGLLIIGFGAHNYSSIKTQYKTPVKRYFIPGLGGYLFNDHRIMNRLTQHEPRLISQNMIRSNVISPRLKHIHPHRTPLIRYIMFR
jgi:hypothetical protein